MKRKRTVLWQILDDKPGHQNQSRGLTAALADLLPLEVCSFRAPSGSRCLRDLLKKEFPLGQNSPSPDLILGAGHATHLAVLAARRARGGQTVILMNPTLPLSFFDLCLIPIHDHVLENDNVVLTRGVLNVIRPSCQHTPGAGLILIGGPSSAYGWSDAKMIRQVLAVVAGSGGISWKLTTSRRTPASFLKNLAKQSVDNLTIVPHHQTTKHWIPSQLEKASQVWVSEDSVSMVYEALTSGAAVGVLEVPNKRKGRVSAGIDSLIRAGWLTGFSTWQPGQQLHVPPMALDEANRCAQIVCNRLLAATQIPPKLPHWRAPNHSSSPFPQI